MTSGMVAGSAGEEPEGPSTESHGAVRALDHSALRLRALEGAAMDAYEWDFAGDRVVFAGDRHARHGFREGAPFTAYLERVCPDDRGPLRAALAALSPEAPRYGAAYRVMDGSGAYVNVIDAGLAHFDGLRRLLRVSGIQRADESGPALQRQTEERYRKLLETVPSMTFEGDAQGGNIFASEQWCAYTGMTAQQTAGFGWRQAVHPDDLPEAAARWERAVRDGRQCEMRHRIRASDGSYRWFLLRARPLREAGGRIERWVGSLTDIDDLQRAEQALRESEGRYRELVQNANSAIIRWRKDGLLTFFNEYAEQFFGYRADEVLGRHVGLLIPDLDSEGADLTQLAEEIVRDPGRFVSNINENICRDGRRVWMSWTNRPILDARGEATEILAIGSDITERIRVEQALRASEERFQLASEIGRSGTWDWDVASGRVVWSRGHFEILGYRVAEVTPSYSAWAERLHPDDRAATEADIRRSMAEGTDYARDFRVVWPDGSIHWMSARARYEYGADGTCRRMVGVMADVTDLKNAEQQMRELNARLGAMLAERTLLAEERGVDLRELAAELTRAEQRERDRLYELLHDHVQPLLVGARLRLSGLDRRTPIETWLKSAAEVRKHIGDALETARSLSVELNPPLVRDQGLGAALDWLCRWVGDSHGLEVQLNCDAGAEPADPATRLLLFKATRELLINVAKHAGANQVTLAMERIADSGLQITVSDRGTGFDAASLALDSGRRSGSGLWSIERRLGMIGGRIEIESQPGAGTTVRILAPLDTPSTPGARAAQDPAPSPTASQFRLGEGSPRRAGKGKPE